MAFPAVQTTNESITATAGTSHVVSLPTGIASGDLLIVFFAIGSVAATVNALAGWTELVDAGVAAGTVILVRTADGTEGASITLTTSASTRDASIVYRISGAENIATQLPELSTVATGTSISPDPGTCTPTGGAKDYLWIAQFSDAGEEADDDTWCNSAPTNYTGLLQKACGIAGTNLAGINATASRQLNAASENPGTFNQDASLAWRAFTVAVHPSSATTYTDSGSGTITLAGSATNTHTLADAPSGTVTLSGSATDSFSGPTVYNDSPSGTVTLGGANTESFSQSYTLAGTITLGGTLTEGWSATGTAAGTITLTGSVTESFQTGEAAAVVYVCWDRQQGIVRGYGDTQEEAEAWWRNHIAGAGTHGRIEDDYEIFTATKE